MRTDTRARLGGAALLALGLALSALTLVDTYRDVLLSADPAPLTLLEHSLPLLLNLVVVAVGGYLVASEAPPVVATSIARWGFIGGVALTVAVAWVYALHLRQGHLTPLVLFANVVTVGVLSGACVGFYDADRSRRRSRLEAGHGKLSALFENSTDCIAEIEFVDGEPIVRDVNPAFERVFGFDADAIVGESIDEVIVPPDDRARATSISQRAESGTRLREEVFRVTASGDVRVFRVQAVPLDEHTADATGYAVYTDITENHRYERRLTALHDATRQLSTTTSTAEIAEMAVDAAAQVLDLELTGMYRHDPSADALVPLVQSEPISALIEEPPTFERGEAIAWEVFEAGEPRYVPDVHAVDAIYDPESPMRSEILLPIGEWGVLIVASESVDSFSDSDYALARILAANVEYAIERARREQRLLAQNERMERLTGIVSHDLRNPLTVAQGYLAMAREDDNGESQSLVRVASALDRIDEMISDLLDLARDGDAIGERSAVELEAVAREAWDSVDTEDATLDVSGDVRLRADESRLRQLLENLFANALEHGRPSVAVRVVETDTGFVVEDDGPGIPEGDREVVLEDGYTTSEDGTGLGLTIVEEIADAHGWDLDVAESESGGARFEFSLSASPERGAPAGDD